MGRLNYSHTRDKIPPPTPYKGQTYLLNEPDEDDGRVQATAVGQDALGLLGHGLGDDWVDRAVLCCVGRDGSEAAPKNTTRAYVGQERACGCLVVDKTRLGCREMVQQNHRRHAFLASCLSKPQRRAPVSKLIDRSS